MSKPFLIRNAECSNALRDCPQPDALRRDMLLALDVGCPHDQRKLGQASDAELVVLNDGFNSSST